MSHQKSNEVSPRRLTGETNFFLPRSVAFSNENDYQAALNTDKQVILLCQTAHRLLNDYARLRTNIERQIHTLGSFPLQSDSNILNIARMQSVLVAGELPRKLDEVEKLLAKASEVLLSSGKSLESHSALMLLKSKTSQARDVINEERRDLGLGESKGFNLNP